MEDINSLKEGDTVLVKCKVACTFTGSQMACVTTRDYDKGFDAYPDEILAVLENDISEEVLKEFIRSNSFSVTNPSNTYKEIRVVPIDILFNILGLHS